MANKRKVANAILNEIEFHNLEEEVLEVYGSDWRSFKEDFKWSAVKNESDFWSRVTRMSQILEEHTM